MTRGWVVAATALTVLGASASEADGQRYRHTRGPKAHVGLAFIAAEPVGELGYFFEQGFGGQLSVGLPIDDYGLFRIVGDVGFIVSKNVVDSRHQLASVSVEVGPNESDTVAMMVLGAAPNPPSIVPLPADSFDGARRHN